MSVNLLMFRFFLVMFFVMGCCKITPAAQQEQEKKKVAITQIVDHPALNATRQGIIDQLEESGFKDGEAIQIFYQNAQGNLAISTQIAQKFASLSPDVCVGIATPSAQSLATYVKSPIIFASVTDPLEAKLVSSLERPEGLVTGVSNAVSFESQLLMMKEFIPSLGKLGVIYNPGEANSRALLRQMRQVCKKMKVELIEVSASKTSEVPGAAQSIIGKVDAIYINNDNTALAAFESIVKVAQQAEKGVFASDNECVDRGAVAALGPNQYQIGRLAGRMIVQLLNGVSLNLIPVAFPEEMELHINRQAAEKAHIKISREMASRAQRVI